MGCLPDLPSELHEPIARHLHDEKASQNAFSLVSLALLPQVHALGVWDTPNLYSSVAEILCRVAHPPPTQHLVEKGSGHRVRQFAWSCFGRSIIRWDVLTQEVRFDMFDVPENTKLRKGSQGSTFIPPRRGIPPNSLPTFDVVGVDARDAAEGGHMRD